MRAIIQRVKHAKVSINDAVKSKIDKGLLVLLSIENEDNENDVSWLAQKVCNLRIFYDKEGLKNLSIKEIEGDILLISNFTLHARIKKGNRPSYIDAAKPETAMPLYNIFHDELKHELKKDIKTGEFGAYMQVELLNDGPVTIFIDTKNKI